MDPALTWAWPGAEASAHLKAELPAPGPWAEQKARNAEEEGANQQVLGDSKPL